MNQPSRRSVTRPTLKPPSPEPPPIADLPIRLPVAEPALSKSRSSAPKPSASQSAASQSAASQSAASQSAAPPAGVPTKDSPTPAPGDHFPENELPRWLMRQAANHLLRVWIAFRGPQYQLLTNFTRDLGICVRSSTDIATGLELCIRAIRRTKLGSRWRDAPRKLRQGSSLTAALSPGRGYLPTFFMPVIKAGEESGRMDDALEFLQLHCKLLASPANSLRNLWLLPVIIMLFGSVVTVLVHLLMGSIGGALTTVLIELIGWGQLVIVVAILMLPPVRFFVDGIRLHAPFLGDFERDVAFHRFFRVMSLLYAVSGQRVEDMVRTAAESVGNSAARIELLKAAKEIENKATISEAFSRVSVLSAEQKTTIEVGDVAGSLELAFDDVSNKAGGNMIAKIGYVQPILMRLVVISTMMAIMGTIASVVLMTR